MSTYSAGILKRACSAGVGDVALLLRCPIDRRIGILACFALSALLVAAGGVPAQDEVKVAKHAVAVDIAATTNEVLAFLAPNQDAAAFAAQHQVQLLYGLQGDSN